MSHLIYVAAMGQAGTSAPVPVIYENTIGDIVWTREAVGVYYGTLSDAFPPDRTVCPPFGRAYGALIPLYYNTPADQFYRVAIQGTHRVKIDFLDAEGNNIEWSSTGAEIFLEVRVYQTA